MQSQGGLILDIGMVFIIASGAVLIPLFISSKAGDYGYGKSRELHPRKKIMDRIMKFSITRKIAASIMILFLIIGGCLGLLLLFCQSYQLSLSDKKQSVRPHA